jgi:SulP family sulfate permease
MSPPYKFNRLEFAGSLGDLGTLLPLAIGMIMINGLNPSGLFLTVGIFYIFSGLYYGITTPVQPMKVIGAYAIAMGLSAPQVAASGALIGLLLLREAAEPYLSLQGLGPVPIGIVIGIVGGVLTLFLLDNKRFPAGLLIVLGGLFLGLLFGTHEGFDKFRLGLYIPKILPFGMPSSIDFSFALLVLVLPQLPMTLGNAVIANADLSREYFEADSSRVTYRALCISQGLANLLSFLVGGMPMCHGAGGLAAHYRFGARTAGSNILIGGIFVVLALFLGTHSLTVVYLLPMSILGVLLIFAGSQLALTIIDLNERKDLFVALVILGITLASNLAVGFVVGIALAYALKSKRLNV